jgi:hypothetical protein
MVKPRVWAYPDPSPVLEFRCALICCVWHVLIYIFSQSYESEFYQLNCMQICLSQPIIPLKVFWQCHKFFNCLASFVESAVLKGKYRDFNAILSKTENVDILV